MSFFRRLPGLIETLGGFGRSAISRAIETGRTIGELLGIIKPLVPEVSVPEVVREWGQVRLAGDREELFGTLAPEVSIPRKLYEVAGPWQQQRYSYEYVLYGRDLATGRFARDYRNLAASRELTPGEVEMYARQAVGRDGESPEFEIFSITLTGAAHIEGETW